MKNFINGLPHFEPLHFGLYLNEDKKPSCLCPCVKGVTRWRDLLQIDWENEELCRFHLMSSKSLIQHCTAKGGFYHKCTLHYLEKLNIKPGKIWAEESIFEGNQKGDVAPGTVDKNDSIYGFVIDRQGNSGSINGEFQYLIFHF